MKDLDVIVKYAQQKRELQIKRVLDENKIKMIS